MDFCCEFDTTVASQIFNISLQITINDFSSLANSEAVKFIWGIGRDIADVFFLFILMYIAIATIIDKAGIVLEVPLARIAKAKTII